MSAKQTNRGLEPLDESRLESVSGGGCGCSSGSSFDWRKLVEMFIYRRIAEARGGNKRDGKSGSGITGLLGRTPNQNGSTNSGSPGNT